MGKQKVETAVSTGPCPICGKHRFLSDKQARKYASRRHTGLHLRTYQCGGYWHITSSDAETTAYFREHPEVSTSPSHTYTTHSNGNEEPVMSSLGDRITLTSNGERIDLADLGSMPGLDDINGLPTAARAVWQVALERAKEGERVPGTPAQQYRWTGTIESLVADIWPLVAQRGHEEDFAESVTSIRNYLRWTHNMNPLTGASRGQPPTWSVTASWNPDPPVRPVPRPPRATTTGGPQPGRLVLKGTITVPATMTQPVTFDDEPEERETPRLDALLAGPAVEELEPESFPCTWKGCTVPPFATQGDMAKHHFATHRTAVAYVADMLDTLEGKPSTGKVIHQALITRGYPGNEDSVRRALGVMMGNGDAVVETKGTSSLQNLWAKAPPGTEPQSRYPCREPGCREGFPVADQRHRHEYEAHPDMSSRKYECRVDGCIDYETDEGGAVRVYTPMALGIHMARGHGLRRDQQAYKIAYKASMLAAERNERMREREAYAEAAVEQAQSRPMAVAPPPVGTGTISPRQAQWLVDERNRLMEENTKLSAQNDQLQAELRKVNQRLATIKAHV